MHHFQVLRATSVISPIHKSSEIHPSLALLKSLNLWFHCCYFQQLKPLLRFVVFWVFFLVYLSPPASSPSRTVVHIVFHIPITSSYTLLLLHFSHPTFHAVSYFSLHLLILLSQLSSILGWNLNPSEQQRCIRMVYGHQKKKKNKNPNFNLAAFPGTTDCNSSGAFSFMTMNQGISM